MVDGQVHWWRGFSLPKRGNAVEEYEDAFAADEVAGRFAIADGASESAFAASWAKVLVEACIVSTGPWSSWLPQAQARWQELINDQKVPWFVERKLEEGAFAALLGVVLRPSRRGKACHWKARAAGDCCLFQVRQERLIRAFPMIRSEEFGNQPPLLGSRRTAPKIRRQQTRGDLEERDYLFLMSDALAQWFLCKVEEGGRPWETLLALGTEQDFSRAIDQLRDRQELRNDDVTLLIIR